MHSRLSYVLTALLVSAAPTLALAKSDQPAPHFTLQVASFPDTAQASRFAAGLVSAGEKPDLDTVEIKGRGFWTRVYLGSFDTTEAARRYGVTLVGRGIIKEFLVKPAESMVALTRPRRVAAVDAKIPTNTPNPNLTVKSKTSALNDGAPSADRNAAPGTRTQLAPAKIESVPRRAVDRVGVPLPFVKVVAFRLAPTVDTNLIPRPDPVDLALRLVTSDARNSSGPAGPRGGLWIGGDTAEGLARLRWIVGAENIGLIGLEPDGRVKLDKKLLTRAAGLRESRVEDPLLAMDYISSNEGLLLLVQIVQGRYRYLLHIGSQAPTSGKHVETTGSINLDNNIDSRINPHRKDGKKLDGERPPAGFDSLIGLNPVARWFNLSTRCWVQGGEIVFHEIAEAYAKLELGVDYLDHGARQGAHSIALERESRLKSQRPEANIVVTTGSNRLLRTKEEIRLFYAEARTGSNQR